MRKILILTIIASFFVLTANAAEEKGQPEAIRSVAQKSLEELGQLVRQAKNYREMGFESPEEVPRAILGDPLQVFLVRLDRLQKYEKGMNPEELLSKVNQYIYPVLVDNTVKSSLTVAETKGQWKTVSFGSPNFIRLLTMNKEKGSESVGAMSAGSFSVQVPALNMSFLGKRSDNTLMLTPVIDDPQLGFEKGVALPAEKVFSALVPLARAHNGLPR